MKEGPKDRKIPSHILKAMKERDSETLSNSGKRSAERKEETKKLIIELQRDLEDLEPRMLQIGTLLQSYSIRDTINEEGDVVVRDLEVDRDVIIELQHTYTDIEKAVLQLRNKIQKLKESLGQKTPK